MVSARAAGAATDDLGGRISAGPTTEEIVPGEFNGAISALLIIGPELLQAMVSTVPAAISTGPSAHGCGR